MCAFYIMDFTVYQQKVNDLSPTPVLDWGFVAKMLWCTVIYNSIISFFYLHCWQYLTSMNQTMYVSCFISWFGFNDHNIQQNTPAHTQQLYMGCVCHLSGGVKCLAVQWNLSNKTLKGITESRICFSIIYNPYRVGVWFICVNEFYHKPTLLGIYTVILLMVLLLIKHWHGWE